MVEGTVQVVGILQLAEDMPLAVGMERVVPEDTEPVVRRGQVGGTLLVVGREHQCLAVDIRDCLDFPYCLKDFSMMSRPGR